MKETATAYSKRRKSLAVLHEDSDEDGSLSVKRDSRENKHSDEDEQDENDQKGSVNKKNKKKRGSLVASSTEAEESEKAFLTDKVKTDSPCSFLRIWIRRGES